MIENKRRHKLFCYSDKSQTGLLIYRLPYTTMKCRRSVSYLCVSVKIVDLATTLKLFCSRLQVTASKKKELPRGRCVLVQPNELSMPGQVLSESFSVVCSTNLLTLLAWQHFTRLIFLTLSLYPTWPLNSGIRETTPPHLPAYKREVASSDWSEVRSEQGLMRHWDWDTAKQRDLCLEATSTHLLSVNSTEEQRLSRVFSSNALCAFVCQGWCF